MQYKKIIRQSTKIVVLEVSSKCTNLNKFSEISKKIQLNNFISDKLKHFIHAKSFVNFNKTVINI